MSRLQTVRLRERFRWRSHPAITEDIDTDCRESSWRMLSILSPFGTALAFWLWFEARKLAVLSEADAFSFLVRVFVIRSLKSPSN